MLSRQAALRLGSARSAARPLSALLLAACLAAAAGCGGDEEGTGGGAPATELTVTLDPDGDGGEPALSETVACPGGPPAACEAIDALPEDPGAPVPPQTACTEIYGGPDTLHVTGTIRGEPVDARLTRSNGCEIERFERFAGLTAALFEGYRPGAALR